MRTLFGILALSTLATVPAYAQTVNEDLKITAGDSQNVDSFGASVAVSGITAVVGAPFSDTNGVLSSGAAYLFDTTTGEQLFKLTPPNPGGGFVFGISVAISGTTAVVGEQDFPSESPARSGAVYVFDTTNGTEQFRLFPPPDVFARRFGASVSISGNMILVGAPLGSESGGYLFDATTGEELFRLRGDDTEPFGDDLGRSVSVSGSLAVVGAPLDDDAGSDSGSAYIFDTTTGQQLFKLTASDAAMGDQFGWSVSVSGNTVIVGAPFDDDAGPDSGSFYVFDATTGQQLFKLKADDLSAGNFFGVSASLSGSTALIGTFNTNAAYVFDTTTGAQLYKLGQSDAAGGDFGFSVSLSGSTAVVGARDDGTGSAYAYRLVPSILEQPVGVVVNSGETAAFNVVATNASETEYQWRRNSIPLVDGGNISGANTSTLSILAGASDVALYDCIITGPLNGPETQTVSVVLGILSDTSTCFGDANGDGVVDLADLNAVLAAFGQACP